MRVRLGCRFAHSQGSVVGNPAIRKSCSLVSGQAGIAPCVFCNRWCTLYPSFVGSGLPRWPGAGGPAFLSLRSQEGYLALGRRMSLAPA